MNIKQLLHELIHWSEHNAEVKTALHDAVNTLTDDAGTATSEPVSSPEPAAPEPAQPAASDAESSDHGA